MSCPDTYCQDWWKDIETTITYCASENVKLNKVLGYTNFTSIGIYGHSMGGAATIHVSDLIENNLGIVASVALHPSCWADTENKDEAKDIKVPMLFFTGSDDDIVPPDGVWRSFNQDTIKPKVCAEIKGANHFEPTELGPNREDAYVGTWFDCFIKGYSNSCNVFFGNNKTNNICTGGPDMTKCQVDP